jgi:hypothetical protein
MDRQPVAIGHLPGFAPVPGQVDILYVVVVVFVLVMILVIGNLYFRLHALPEQMAHRANRIQFEIVAILALISLFTHNTLFWIAALLLAFIEFPDISTPSASISRSLENLSPISRSLDTIAHRLDRGAIDQEPPPSSGTALPPDDAPRV